MKSERDEPTYRETRPAKEKEFEERDQGRKRQKKGNEESEPPKKEVKRIFIERENGKSETTIKILTEPSEVVRI